MRKLKILAIACVLLMTTSVHAALQSRPGVDAKTNTTVSDFFKYIREMEKEGGALGLNATFAENASGAYEETTPSNNIDVHMCKNTEWGAAAMLSASEYGAGVGKVDSNYDSSTKKYGLTASTTGNMTGIFGMHSGAAEFEYMAAGMLSSMYVENNRYLMKAPVRYVDNYAYGDDSSDFTRYIVGDATYETKSFLGNECSFVASNAPVFERGITGAFSFSAFNGTPFSGNGSRACVWVGTGL